MPKYTLTQEQKEILEQNKWLTDRERMIFQFFYQRGWSIESIAAECEIHRRTVDRILSKLRNVAKVS